MRPIRSFQEPSLALPFMRRIVSLSGRLGTRLLWFEKSIQLVQATFAKT
jgi:hypothetical protein